jgi:Tfp pilus assembly protein PilF
MSSGTCTRMIVAVAAVFLAQQGFGQAQGGGATAPAGGGAGGAGSTTPAPSPSIPNTRTPTITQPQQQQQQQQPQQVQQPIFVSGRVMMEDGTAPPDQVVIERVCNGQPKSEGYTDSKGFFGFEIGRQNNGMIHDASEDISNDPFSNRGGFGNSASSNNRMMGGSDSRLMGCELRARLVGYRSQVVSLSMRRPLDNPDVGIILLHRMGSNEGGTVSAISAAAPKEAKKAYEKGVDSMKKKKADDAVKSLEKAVELYPKYATAWYELGRVRQAKGDKEGARTAFDTAVRTDPKYINPYLELANLEAQTQKWDQVADLTAAAIKLDPFFYPQAHFLNAVANYNLKNWEAAEKSALEAERLDTRRAFPQTFQLLGILLANRQDYKAAADRLRSYMKFMPPTTDFTNVKNQLEQLDRFIAQSAAAPKQ